MLIDEIKNEEEQKEEIQYHPDIKTALMALQIDKNYALLLNKYALVLQEYVDGFEGENEIDVYLSCRTSYSRGASIRFYIKDKLKEVEDFIKGLQELGYHHLRTPKDSSEEKSRTWYMGMVSGQEVNESPNKLILRAILPDNADASCKYVQVGVKEVPVYELQCDEEKKEEGGD